jgi:polysaccharide export outer membrane protein
MKLLSSGFLPAIAICMIMFSACTSTKEMIYLQDRQTDASVQTELLKSIRYQAMAYRLRPDDQLQIHVFTLTDDKLNFFKKPEVDVRVNSKGEIILPVIGTVAVQGLTIKETEEKLKQVMAEYLRSPEITLKLLNYNITVLGEVFKQGVFNMGDSKVTILSAIGEAGGLTDNANMKNIRIIRNENDTARIYQLSLIDDNLISSDKFFLQPNDIVLVNPLKAKTSREQRIGFISLIVSIMSSLAFIFTRK